MPEARRWNRDSVDRKSNLHRPQAGRSDQHLERNHVCKYEPLDESPHRLVESRSGNLPPCCIPACSTARSHRCCKSSHHHNPSHSDIHLLDRHPRAPDLHLGEWGQDQSKLSLYSGAAAVGTTNHNGVEVLLWRECGSVAVAPSRAISSKLMGPASH